MRWEALFADLEAQLAGAEQQSLDSEVSERIRLDHSGLRMVSRFRGNLGSELSIRVFSGQKFAGAAVSVGSEWVVLRIGGRSILVPFAAIIYVEGLGRETLPEHSIIGRKLGLTSALRALSRDRAAVQLQTGEVGRQSSIDGIIDRVGRDFLDLAIVPAHEFRRVRSVSGVITVPLHAITAVISV